jgi:sugar phosphate isomerase/epimerase
MKIILCIYSCFFSLCSVRADEVFQPEFYAFYNGMPEMSYDDEAKFLKELGYDGISQIYGAGEPLEQRVTAYQKQDLKVLSVYLEATENAIDAGMVMALKDGGMIELTVAKISPEVIDSIRKTAEMASRLNIRVVLYPHFGNAVATMPQAIEVVEKVNHPNLGVMFNLCHFLKSEKAEDLESVLLRAKPHLFSVSINGADGDGTNWDTLIQPLDKGNFPQQRLLGVLKKMQYKGPVCLQCYAVKGDKKSNLKKSIDAWEKLLKELP